MLCPSCKTTSLAMTDRQGIEIDYCPDCRGIWLDRGELDRLIERAERDVAQPAQAPYREPSHHRGDHHPERSHAGDRHAHGQRRKPKSLLGELFDF